MQVEELRQRLEEKNRHIEKKTQQTMQATQDRNRMNSELSELKDHMDIKDRKINVLQRKVYNYLELFISQASSGFEVNIILKLLIDNSVSIRYYITCFKLSTDKFYKHKLTMTVLVTFL